MICTNCSKLVFLSNTNKKCVKCQTSIHSNLLVLCNNCSIVDKQCGVCLKKILPVNKYKGCGCGK